MSAHNLIRVPLVCQRVAKGCESCDFPVGAVYHQIAMLGGRTNEQWIAQYACSHQHRVNRICHTLGIPSILISLALFVGGVFIHRLWVYGLALFLVGWTLQFIGHGFERKPPEFFHDWRFLFVGVRWWWAKIQGKA